MIDDERSIEEAGSGQRPRALAVRAAIRSGMVGGGSRDGVGLGRARRTFTALARALCPSEGLTDELVEATTEEVAALVATLAPAMRRALRALALTLEYGTRVRGGGAFSDLDVEDAREALAHWSRGPLRVPVRLMRDLV